MAKNVPTIDPSDRVLRMPEVCRRLGLTRNVIWKMWRDGRFPPPFQLTSESTVGWLASEVDAWLAERVANRRTRDDASTRGKAGGAKLRELARQRREDAAGKAKPVPAGKAVGTARRNRGANAAPQHAE